MTANNNNNNSSSSSSLSEKERQEQETIVLWEFRNAFQNCHERLLIMEDNDTTEKRLTDDEHSSIERLYSDPTWYCVGAGLLTLGLLRTGRYVRRYRAARYNSSSRYTLDRRPSLQQPPQQQQTPASSFFTWKTVLVDIVFCSFAGAVTGTYMVDMNEAQGGLDQLALVPGRSGVANEFCPVILEEYQEQWKQQQLLEHNSNTNNNNNMVSMADSGGEEEDTHDNNTTANNTATIVDLGVVSVQIQADPIPPDAHKQILQNPNNPNLQAYLRFAKNCKARHAMERRLRKDWGLTEKASVAIPPPGVVEVRDDDGEDEWDEPSNEKISADDGEWTQDEVSSWVSDQEDEKR